MSQRTPPDTYRELVSLFIEFLSEPEGETLEEVDEYLRDAGYDPDDLVTSLQHRIKKAMDTWPMPDNGTENRSSKSKR